VELALERDDPGPLVAAAGEELGRPLGVSGPGGEALGWAPDDEQGRRALAVARAAVRGNVVPPSGWSVTRIGDRPLHGVLAVGEAPGADDGREIEGLLVALLSEQLRRVELIRVQDGAFVRRLVSDPPLEPHRARREAAELGIALADAYRVGLVTWRSGAARVDALEEVEHEARTLVPDAMTTLLEGRLVLLHPARGRADAAAAAEWFASVTARLAQLAPASRARGIAHERAIDLGGLSRAVALLSTLGRLGPRACDDGPLTWTRQYALDRMLAAEVRASSAAAFVRDQLGPLEDWDREHGGDLLGILEAALDHPRHQDEAARRCFVHRNTFRHRLRRALEILGDPLDDPDVRLAVHIALKLRRLAPQHGAPAAVLRHRDGRRA
jgi:sugar diacid utilization regulator